MSLGSMSGGRKLRVYGMSREQNRKKGEETDNTGEMKSREGGGNQE